MKKEHESKMERRREGEGMKGKSMKSKNGFVAGPGVSMMAKKGK